MKRTHRGYILSILLLVTAAIYGCQTSTSTPAAVEPGSATETGAVIKLVADAPTVAVEQIVEVSAHIENVADLYGVELWLDFDSERLALLDADVDQPGRQVASGDFLSPDFVAQNEGRQDDGSIVFVVTQIPPREPVSGAGTLVTMRFQAMQPGPAAITWQQVLLASAEGEPISSQQQSTSITITE